MSDMQKAISLVIDTFCKYSGREGDPTTLTKAELKELLQNELGELVGKAPDKAAVDRIFSDLDSNQDNLVDFAEFGRMFICLTTMCHEFFTKKK